MVLVAVLLLLLLLLLVGLTVVRHGRPCPLALRVLLLTFWPTPSRFGRGPLGSFLTWRVQAHRCGAWEKRRLVHVLCLCVERCVRQGRRQHNNNLWLVMKWWGPRLPACKRVRRWLHSHPPTTTVPAHSTPRSGPRGTGHKRCRPAAAAAAAAPSPFPQRHTHTHTPHQASAPAGREVKEIMPPGGHGKKGKGGGGGRPQPYFAEVDPAGVYFSHARIRTTFSGCGRKVEDTVSRDPIHRWIHSPLPPSPFFHSPEYPPHPPPVGRDCGGQTQAGRLALHHGHALQRHGPLLLPQQPPLVGAQAMQRAGVAKRDPRAGADRGVQVQHRHLLADGQGLPQMKC